MRRKSRHSAKKRGKREKRHKRKWENPEPQTPIEGAFNMEGVPKIGKEGQKSATNIENTAL